MTQPHITVCICTFKRPDMLRRLLLKLEEQQTAGAFTFSVAVVDNDATGSARATVEECAAATGREIRYAIEPEQNIARARNRVFGLARGEYLACIDDDEFPTPRWLALLLAACRENGVAGVLGPVLPDYAVPAPDWIVRGGMFDRPRHLSGTGIGLGDARTGNVLLDRGPLAGTPEPFDVRFGSGGEDVDFFRRRMAQGQRFIWCDEAAVYETVPASRLTRGYQLRRALLRGRNSLRQRGGRARKLATSLVALPLYTLALPPLALAGQHHFMKYLIKWCDHAGRLLAAVGISAVRQRDG
jgi:glycosyltransferase involved in cell wall biosynthesis